MKLFDIIALHNKKITPKNSKIHLACWDGSDDPLSLFFTNRFEEWQTWQTKRNFSRDHIVSLIKLSGQNKWLFAGIYNSIRSEKRGTLYKYEITPMLGLEELTGRIVVTHKRRGRNSYPLAENCCDDMIVHEIKPERLTISDFPGFAHIVINNKTLKLITGQSSLSWKAALSSVSGIYLITDTHTGKLYVGKASGAGGIWGRWNSYAATGHGGNVDLKKVIKINGEDYCKHFQYSVLETADTNASEDDILQRESYWKTVLCTRKHGYNRN